MITRVLLLRKVDREDYWVKGITLPIHPGRGDTYTDMLEPHRPYLESKEVVDWLVEEFCLQDDAFNNDYDDHDFSFQRLDINHRATWVFINGEGETHEFTLECDTIYSLTGTTAEPAP